MNTIVFFLFLFVSLVFASKENGQVKKKKSFKVKRNVLNDSNALSSRTVLVRKANSSTEPLITTSTTTISSPSQSATTDYSSSSNYDSTESNSGLTEEELCSFGFINFGNSEDALIGAEEDAPVDDEEKLVVGSNSQNNNETQTFDYFETLTDAMAVSGDQKKVGFFEIPWDTEFEGQWCLSPIELNQLRAATDFKIFEDFLSSPADSKITIFDKNLIVDLNWPEMGPTAPRLRPLSIRFQILAIYALVKDYPVEKLRELVSARLIDLKLPIYDSSTGIYKSFLSFAVDRDSRNLEKIDLFLRFMPRHMVNKPDSKGVTPLEVAIMRNDLVLVKKLVESGADMNISTDPSKNTPFMRAILSNNVEMIEYLIETGKVDFFNGFSVLSLATIHFNSDLMQKALNVLSESPNYRTIEFSEVLKRLFDDSPTTYEALVMEIVKSKKLKLIMVPTFFAFLKNKFEMMKYLNSSNVPMNIIIPCKRHVKYRFIHIAAARGQLEMFKLFLSFGISPLELTGTGKSILYVAYVSNQFHIVEEILKMGVYLGLFECLDHAVAIENLPMIHAILNSPLNLNEENFPSGHNLITKAIALDKPQIIEILIQSGKVNLYHPDKLGQTIHNILIPGNASESLKTIVKREVEKFNEILRALL